MAGELTSKPAWDRLIDVKGEYCPVPVSRVQEILPAMKIGEVLCVVGTDPLMIVDLPAWCYGNGQEFIGYYREHETIHCFIKKNRKTIAE